MPKILEDRRKAIARGNPNLSESSTWAIATSALQKEGKLPRKKSYQAGGLVGGGGGGEENEDPSGDVLDTSGRVIGHVKKRGEISTGSTSYGGGSANLSTEGGVSGYNYCKGGKVISKRDV